LEIGEDRYATRFARPGAMQRLDILSVTDDNPHATIVADLSNRNDLPSDGFDCVICTQTLLLIYDVRAAVRTLHRVLKPGGTVLATLPGISQICRSESDLWSDYWRFTSFSARRLFEEAFAPEDVHVQAYGNVLAAASFLYGLASQDLREHELELRDPEYELTIGVRATKRPESSSALAQPDP
jgi:SAM-dependent methyltransferase